MGEFSGSLVLTGATGSGKTALALELAERLNAEIIALDSMTFYRGLDIGTAKPTMEERRRVPHHMIDVLDPHESASVAWWLVQSKIICMDIVRRGKTPLFVGGTPMYLKALLQGLFDAPQVDPSIRARIDDPAIDNIALHERLRTVDPKTAARLHPNDRRRVVRALEVFEATGTPISDYQKTWSGETFTNEPETVATIPAVLLDWPREELYARIDRRVLAMIDAGWIDECRKLMKTPLSKEARQAVGYAELFEYLALGEQGLGTVIERIQTRTRQFAKRQLTWFRKLPLTPLAAESERLADACLNCFRTISERF